MSSCPDPTDPLVTPRARSHQPRRLSGLPAASAALALALGLGLAEPALAAGKLDVQYVDAEKFADIGFGGIERERNLKTLSDCLQKLAAQLPDGQTLQLTVLDVDLAGQVWPGSLREVRVLRGRADWPRVHLQYTLRQGDTTLKSGDAQISDMDYLDHTVLLADNQGSLSYERRMLQVWFRKTFIDAHP